MYLKTHAKNSILANVNMSKNEIQHQPLTTSDTNTNPQSVPSLEDMRKQMPENLPDRKPLQMKTCFESSPTLEISDERMEK